MSIKQDFKTTIDSIEHLKGNYRTIARKSEAYEIEKSSELAKELVLPDLDRLAEIAPDTDEAQEPIKKLRDNYVFLADNATAYAIETIEDFSDRFVKDLDILLDLMRKLHRRY